MNGPFFENFVRLHFNFCFAWCGPKKTVVASFLMDNDPSQTKLHKKRCMENIDAKFLKTPARSPDLNPIGKEKPG
jgi:hypothetical protein